MSPLPMPRPIADDVTSRFEAGEFDVAHLFFARFRSALVQEPTEIQIIPAALPAAVTEAKPGEAPAAIEYEPDEEAILAELLPRNLARPDLPRAARKRRLRTGQPHDRDGQCDPQRRRHDQETHHHL